MEGVPDLIHCHVDPKPKCWYGTFCTTLVKPFFSLYKPYLHHHDALKLILILTSAANRDGCDQVVRMIPSEAHSRKHSHSPDGPHLVLCQIDPSQISMPFTMMTSVTLDCPTHILELLNGVTQYVKKNHHLKRY